MANVNRPQGLKPVKSLLSGDWDGRGNVYHIISTDATSSYYSGDVVSLSGTGDANGVPGISKYIANAAAAGAGVNGAGPVGVIVAVGINATGPWINPTDLTVRSAPQIKTRDYYALVVDDPFVIFEVQEGGSGTALAATAIGLNCNLTIVPAQSTGYESATILDNASEVATIGLDVRLMGLSRVSDNAFGFNAKWLVMLNSHAYKMTTGI